MNPYNKKLETYKTTSLSNLGPGEQVATLLTSAAKNIYSAHAAMLNHDHESRTKFSEMSIMILEGLANVLEAQDSSQGPIAKELENYYMAMIAMIGRMNIMNDAKVCESIGRSLEQMAQTWIAGQRDLLKINTQELVSKTNNESVNFSA